MYRTNFAGRMLPLIPSLAYCAMSTLAFSQSFSSYSDLQALASSNPQSVQVKLTFVGPRTDIMPGVAFSPGPIDLTQFLPFQRPNVDYGVDGDSVETFTSTPAELQAALADLSALPAITSGGVAADQRLSFAIAGGGKGFESILGQSDAVVLFSHLRSVFANNPGALHAFSDMSCPMGAIDPVVATDVTSKVSVTFSGVRLNRANGHFLGTAALKNNSGADLTGPVSLVLDLPGNLSLANAVGNTCGISPVGRPYINATLSGNSFPAAGTVTLNLDFVNPDSQPIVPVSKVLAGPGSR